MDKKSQPASNNTIQWEWQSNANPWSSDEVPEWTPYDPYHNNVLENAYQNKEKVVELGDYIVLIDEKNMIQQKKNDLFKKRRVRRKDASCKSVEEQNFIGAGNKIKVQWEWQANNDPWFSAEKVQWAPYKPHENNLLETAYKNGYKEVDLGDYIVIFGERDIIQQKKIDISKRRRVRRREDSSIDNSIGPEMRTERFFGVEKPKTYNKTFGSLQDFLVFFENRGPEIQKFAKLFKEIENSFDPNRFNQEIIPVLIDSISKEFSRKKNQTEGGVLELFKKQKYVSLQQFYGDVLKAYTMPGFLYRNLNKYLRDEDWVELDYLLPYVFCLYKAFLYEEFILSSFQKNSNNNQPKLTLYRGAALEEKDLSFYKGQLVKNFSWYAVTSTSTNRKVAEFFTKEKMPVIFIIEVPLNSDKLNCQNWLDLKQFSVFPSEDEIALGPGSTFKLVSFQKNGKFTEIKLEVITNFPTLASEGQILHGVFQAQMTNDIQSILAWLEGNDLAEALCHLKGNKLIEKFELYFCTFDELALKILSGALLSVPNLKKVSFICSASTNHTHLNVIMKTLLQLKVLELKFHDKLLENENHMMSFAQGLKDLRLLTTLNLNFNSLKITDEGLNLCFQAIGFLASLATLKMDFNGCNKITEKGLNCLCSEGLKQLTSLKYLKLNFRDTAIDCSCLKNLGSEGIKYLTSLKTLKIFYTIVSVGGSSVVEQEQELKAFYKQLAQSLSSLDELELYATKSFPTFDMPQKYLFQSVEFRDKLKGSFTRKIQNNQEIKSQSSGQMIHLNDARVDSITNLNSPTALELNFKKQFSCEELNQLCSKGITNLTSLITLSLDFSNCESVSDEALKILGSQGIKSLTLLTRLCLNFEHCNKITDRGIGHLCAEGIKNLTSLTTLDLNFSECNFISDESLGHLCSQVRKHLLFLTELRVDFSFSKISSQSFRSFVKILKYFGFGFHAVDNLSNAKKALLKKMSAVI